MQPFSRLSAYLSCPVSIAPLVSFRVVFGAVMVLSTLRFWWLGWIDDHFVSTHFTFKYFGFEWVQLLPPKAMYALHAVMAAAAFGVMLGWYYRASALAFFISFTYVWLVDLTYYLNHYYFVSIVSGLLVLTPAHRRFSMDAWRRPQLRAASAPRWTVDMFKWQIAIVYIFAGLAKINHEWLIEAMPLRIWLPANDKLPLIGGLLAWEWSPWLFSWAGMLFDLTIVAWLCWRKTRAIAYLTVLFFHGVTGAMFQIGVFPIVMMGATWIFFSEGFHERLLGFFEKKGQPAAPSLLATGSVSASQKSPTWLPGLLVLHFAVQLLFPWRHLLYPGDPLWTEQGYRFGWRVMLMEKAGTATFYVKDSRTGREGQVFNEEFLCSHQEKQMAMQPDMILQYARFLAQHYERQGIYDPQVRAEVYVTLNARPSQLLFDPHLDLLTVRDGWGHKGWIWESPRFGAAKAPLSLDKLN
jgi:hypothetical protein